MRGWRSAVVGWLCVLGCGDGPPPSLRPPSTTAFVSPEGDDRSEGTREAPFRTVARALSGSFTSVVLLTGVHSEGAFVVARPVQLEGETGASIRGALRVESGEVRLRRLAVAGSVEAAGVADLSVETTTVAADGPHALRIDQSFAVLRSLTLECGSETCLYATSATITAHDLRATATATTTKRLLRFEEGRAELARLRLRGGSIAAVSLAARARAFLEDAEITGSSNGIAAVAGSTLIAEDVAVLGAARTSLVLQDATAELRGGRYDGTPELTVGISGSELALTNVSIGGSPLAAVSISRYLDRPARVRIDGGTVEHGAFPAITVDGSELVVRGAHFVGDPSTDGDDAIIASGPGTTVSIVGALFEGPSGFGVGLYSGASGTVTATIVSPRLGGVLVDGGGDVTITDTSVSGCAQGSGVALQGSTGTILRRVSVDGCAEAGVLALDASGSVEASVLTSNAQFGAAAFSGGTLTVASSTISGSPFATFATCGDGARVELLEGNRISGPTTDCP